MASWSRLRGAALRMGPPASLTVLTASTFASAAGSSTSPTAAAAAAAAPLSFRGAGVASVSTAQYQANELLEDRIFVASRNGAVVAGVLDGHGGWQAAEFGRQTLAGTVFEELKNAANPRDLKEVAGALTRSFQRTDREFIDAIRGAFKVGFGQVSHVGACALTAYVSPAGIVVANAGDCRAVLGRVTMQRPATGNGETPASLGDKAASSSSSSLSLARVMDELNNSNNSSSNATSVKKTATPAGPVTVAAASTLAASPRASTFRLRSGLYATALALSDDHNARVEAERARLEMEHPGEADIVVCKRADACYVKGRLQPTRALGDAYLKHSEFNGQPSVGRAQGRFIPAPYTPPYISPTPEVQLVAGNPGLLNSSGDKAAVPRTGKATEGAFLVLGCDGLWDVLSCEEVVAFVAEDAGDRATVADRLVQYVLEREAASAGIDLEQLMLLAPGKLRRALHDDISVVVVYLGEAPVANESGEAAKPWWKFW